MNELELLVKLHINQERQGPGSKQETLQAATLAGLDINTPYKIADIGAGTGASSLTLAENFNCTIDAVDFLPDFVEQLNKRIKSVGKTNQISAHIADMSDLPFDKESFDVIWSEGAIYNMGFEKGISSWRDFLKPGGKIAISEITWLTEHRPEAITNFWQEHYPEVATASVKIAQLEKHGYKMLGYFPLKESSWLENYYRPLQSQFDTFLEDHAKEDLASSVIDEHEQEIALYNQYKAYFSYGFYIAEKL